jgi:hypothetical protein
MSADLFAAFGPPRSSQKPNYNQREGDSGPATSPNVLIPDIETLSINQHTFPHKEPSGPKQEDNQPLWRQDEGGTDVIFDATEDAPQVDDEFGDFEDANATGETHTVSPSANYPKPESRGLAMSSDMPTPDLLGLDQEDASVTGPSVTADPVLGSVGSVSFSNTEKPTSTTPAEDEWGDFSAPDTYEAPPPLGFTKMTTKPTPTRTIGIEQDLIEEDWDVFDEGGTRPSTLAQAEKSSSGLVAAQATPAPHLHPPPKLNPWSKHTHTQTAETIRPSNIPPPAILLQLLPGAFDELRQNVTQHVGKNSSPSTHKPQRDVALKIIQAFTVAARVISGRVLRWKRDAILAQSMRMGPAASRGGGRGMKLAAIDKTESLKEDKEAADVVEAWEKSAHLFNSTVSKAGVQRPLMALYLSVRPRLAAGVDVLRASHACALCGINRDERVPHAESSVEDSFGEYWVEHWGHRDCRDFWITYKDRLHQR